MTGPTLHAFRGPTRITVTRHRATGEWLVTAFGHTSLRYPSHEDAIFAADGMRWAIRAYLFRCGMIARTWR